MRQLGAAGPGCPCQQSLPRWRSFNPLSRRAGSIAQHRSAHRGGLELSTGTGLYGACRSTQCCLAVWSRWVESSTRLGGFRALKKTTEAPYTTKVNYRDHTSRGTTRPRRVMDSTHLDHTARQHWVDRHAPYSPAPVLNSSPLRWAEWHFDRSCSSGERIEASPAR